MPRILALIFLQLTAVVGLAQSFNFDSQRQPVISLDGKWRFHIGDDPRWADPNFDDRSWSLLRSDKDWGEQGYKGGIVGWYRFEIQDVGNQPVTLLLQKFWDSYQIFANGKLLGGEGKLPPHPEHQGNLWAVYQIPRLSASRNLHIAIRVWRVPYFAKFWGGGPTEKGALLGRPDLIASRFREHMMGSGWSNTVGLILCVLETLAGLAALSLYFLASPESEYLWYSLAQLSSACLGWWGIYSLFALVPAASIEFAIFTYSFYYVFDILFFLTIFQARRSWLFWAALSGYLLGGVLYEIYMHDAVPANMHGVISPIVCFGLMRLGTFVLFCWLFWAAWRGVRRGVIDAQLLFVPVTLDCLVGLITSSVSEVSYFNIPIPKVLSRLTYGFDIAYLHLDLSDLTNLLVLLAALAVLIARFVRTRRDEEQHTRDLEAARTLQHMLVPAETPAVPGFSIASIYQPAQEVGGDFFQIIPLAQGVLLAIGDVSGKGLPAAMTVSLAIGALRTLADQTSSPSAILAGLNRRLIGRSAGFTTCLIAHLNSNGQATIANAGHLPPYRNGQELATIANLPLGLSEDATYEESPLTLHAQDRFTFLSDGVLEAKNKQGELFGFARTQQTSTQPAAIIATAAQQFGQEDDITVLTVQYQPVPTPA